MVTALGINTVRIIPLDAKPLGHVWLPVDYYSVCTRDCVSLRDVVYHPLSALWAAWLPLGVSSP